MKIEVRLLIWLCLGAFTTFNSQAQNLTNMAGVWNGLAFDVPAQLLPEFSGGLVTNVSGHDAFGADSFQVTAYSNGTFTNANSTGTMFIDGQGKLTVLPAGGAPIYFRVNFAQDVFAGISTNYDNGLSHYELNLITRPPASLATNDVTGTWQLIMLDTPQQLTQIYLPTTNASAVSDLRGLDNQSVTNAPLNQTGGGFMTFHADGTLSGNAGDPFTGTYGLAANGECDLVIGSGSGSFFLTGFINASKDTMVALHKEDVNNRQEIVLLTKPPTNAVLADLQGVWQVTSFEVPDQLKLTLNASNFVTAADTLSGFGMDQQAFTSGHDGFVTAVLHGQANVGGFNVSTNGIITVTFTNTSSQTRTYTGQLNAGKDCFTLVADDSSQANLSIVTRAPDFPSAGGQNFGLLFFGNSVCWASGTNRLLQTTGSLGGGWTNLPATQGQHQLSIAFTNRAGFFRVSQ